MRRLIAIILSALFFLPAGATAGTLRRSSTLSTSPARSLPIRPISTPPIYRVPPPLDLPPTLSDCQDAEFLATATEPDKNVCSDILQAKVAEERAATIEDETQNFTQVVLTDPDTGLAKIDVDTGELVITAEVDPNEERDLEYRRGAELFGRGSRTQAQPGNQVSITRYPGGIYRRQPDLIASCDDYASTRFGDYADYFRGIEAFGSDYRAIFEYAFGNASSVGGSGLGDGSLLSSDGYEFDEDQMEWPILKIPSAPVSVRPSLSDSSVRGRMIDLRIAHVQIETLTADPSPASQEAPALWKVRDSAQLARPVTRSVPALSRAFGKETQPSSRWVVPVPKNEFFALSAAELRYVRDNASPGIYEKLQAGREYYDRSQTTGWEWHRNMSNNLAFEEDALLFHHRKRRNEFARVLADIRAAYGHDLPDGTPIRSCLLPALPQQSGGREVIGPATHCRDAGPLPLLIELLEAAEAEGCLDIDQTVTVDYGPCDWSPQDFHEEFAQVMSAKQHAERLRCVELTGFADLRDVPEGDRASASSFDGYLDGLEANREAMIASIVAGETEPPRRSHYWGSGDDYGSEKLGASWSAHTQFDSLDLTQPGICGFKPSFEAGANADVRLWSASRRVFSAVAKFDLRKGIQQIDLEILGTDYYKEPWENDGTKSAQFTFSRPGTLWERDKRIVEGSKTFMVYSVPVTVAAGLYGRLGLDFNIARSVVGPWSGDPSDDSCVLAVDLTLAVTVEPSASLYTQFAAGIGVSGILAGAFGEVVLARIGLPVTFAAAASLPADDLFADSVGSRVGIELSGALTLRTLNGHLGVFLEVGPWFLTKKLYSWNGIGTDLPLFDFSYDKTWASLNSICNHAGVSCDG